MSSSVGKTKRLWLCKGQNQQKIAILLSDISGAFDKVHKDRLMLKLRSAGLCDKLLILLDNYLNARSAVVTVDGAMSEAFSLANMVFQGTVLGPCLWNVFFNDVSKSVTKTGFDDTKFADAMLCAMLLCVRLYVFTRCGPSSF